MYFQMTNQLEYGRSQSYIVRSQLYKNLGRVGFYFLCIFG